MFMKRGLFNRQSPFLFYLISNNNTMRYKKEAKQLICKLYKDVPVESIAAKLIEQGFRKRSSNSIETVITKYKKQKRKDYRIQWAKDNPNRYRAMTLVNGAKQRAKNKGIPFNLTVDYIEQILGEGKCQVTGLPFEIKPYSENGHLCDKSMFVPSLDQINPSGGYTMDNVQVVVYNFNTFKSSGSMDDIMKTAIALVSKYGEDYGVQAFA